MKKLLLLLVLVCTMTSCGVTKRFTYPALPAIKKSIELTTNKNFNYIRANEWMVEHFVSAKEVVQFSDKEAGIVKGKYLLKKGTYTPGVHVGYGITTEPASTPAHYAIVTVRVKDSAAVIEIIPSSEEFMTYVSRGKEQGFSPTQAAIKIKLLMFDFSQRMGNDILKVEDFDIAKPKTKRDLFRESNDYKKYLERTKNKSKKKKIKLLNLYYSRWNAKF